MTSRDDHDDHGVDLLLADARARYLARLDASSDFEAGLADVRGRAASPEDLPLTDLALTLDSESWLRWLSHQGGQHGRASRRRDEDGQAGNQARDRH